MKVRVLPYHLWESINLQYASLLENERESFSYSDLLRLVLEAVNHEDAIKYIDKKQTIRIFYEGDDKVTKGWRYVEPLVLGVSTAGNIVLRAYQFKGPSTQDSQGWRLFRADRIREWSPIGKSFFQQRPMYNPDGDRGMITIYAQAKF